MWTNNSSLLMLAMLVYDVDHKGDEEHRMALEVGVCMP